MQHNNPIYRNQVKVIYDRNSTIPPTFVGARARIHTGKSFTTRNIKTWMVGFKFGEFTWNRKLALYKAKQLRKKAKKK